MPSPSARCITCTWSASENTPVIASSARSRSSSAAMPRSTWGSSSASGASPSIRMRIVEVPVKRARIALSAAITGASASNQERNAVFTSMRSIPSAITATNATAAAITRRGCARTACVEPVDATVETPVAALGERLGRARRAQQRAHGGDEGQLEHERREDAERRHQTEVADGRDRRRSRAIRSRPRRCRTRSPSRVRCGGSRPRPRRGCRRARGTTRSSASGSARRGPPRPRARAPR